MKSIKYLLSGIYPPISLIPILCLLVSKTDKRIIEMDVARWKKEVHLNSDIGFYHALSHLLLWHKEFRNLLYRRMGKTGKILSRVLPGEKTLYLPPSPIGGGFFIRHGYSTFVNTHRIGDNLTIHQNTTIGDDGRGGYPTIGNNVFIGTGAIIIGDITIGDNAKIGAGAIVVDSVPANSVILSPKARKK